MTTRVEISGFYAVLDRDDEALARTLVSSGARVLQVRLKPRGARIGAREILAAAHMARRVCDESGARLVVNDRFDIALLANADGVHLGQTDLSIATVRAIVGTRLAIGVSTHDLAQVRAAVTAGADYLGYGPVFGTTTKENPDAVQGIDALRAAVGAAGDVPIVAIGGITSDRVADVYATGARAICAISAVNQAPDVGLAARSFARS
jgi:thiamine-phosphate pyrophosphorylase